MAWIPQRKPLLKKRLVKWSWMDRKTGRADVNAACMGGEGTRKLFFSLFHAGPCEGTHMARLATFEGWMLRAFLLMAAIAGTIGAPGMIGHELAHGVALPWTFQRMTFLAGAFDVALALLVEHMMTGAACDTFMTAVIESHIKLGIIAIIKQDGLVSGQQIARLDSLREKQKEYQGQDFHNVTFSKHIPERWFQRNKLFFRSDKIQMHQA